MAYAALRSSEGREQGRVTGTRCWWVTGAGAKYLLLVSALASLRII